MAKILADSKLEKLLLKKALVLEPEIDKSQIRPASIDLRLGRIYDRYGEELSDNQGTYHLLPGKKYYMETMEEIKTDINGEYSFHIIPRSSFGRALVSISPLESYMTIGPRSNAGKIKCSIKSGIFDIDVKVGDKIIQLIGFKGNTSESNNYHLSIGKFLDPLIHKSAAPAEGVRDSELFTDSCKTYKIADRDTYVKCISNETVNYSDKKRAAIVECHSRGRAFSKGSKMNISYVDPGYSGSLFGLIIGEENHEKINRGEKFLSVREYEIYGKVKEGYNSKKVGSHYNH